VPDDVRKALQVSIVSIAWTVLTSAAAVSLGFARHSLVLVAYGLTGALDTAGSVALVIHFRHALRHDVLSARHERVAHRLVTVGLVVVGLATTAESVRRLIVGDHPETVVAGVALSAVSAVVLALLSGRKRRAGRSVPSPALVADGWLSATGALLAVVTVAGTGFVALGWWWADAVAATVVGVGAMVGGILLGRPRRSGRAGQPDPL
jgi:divalent metal cation (Fe/Co/Zn/Cd) transporter